MMRDVDAIISVDQGTTNTKAICVDASGNVLSSASVPSHLERGDGNRVEQDADELLAAVREVILRCIARAPQARVAGIALSTQRESVVAWDRRTGEALSPVISWQDVRTSWVCESLRLSDGAEEVVERTGLPIDPMFSATKFAYLSNSLGRAGHIAMGTIESWLVFALTGEHVAEAGNASRTQLFDLERLAWSPDLADFFGVDLSCLGRIVRSDESLGPITASGLPAVPILAVYADSHAALRSYGRVEPGVIKATYGTGSSIMTAVAPGLSSPGVARTLAWLEDEPVYALEGNIRHSGATLAWMSGLLGLSDVASLNDLASHADPDGSPVLVPAFGGLGAPHWDGGAIGLLAGLTESTGRSQLARAAFEAVCMQIADVVDAMAELTGPPKFIVADGGATVSDLLMQTQADLVGTPVVRSGFAERSAFGAALAAGEGLGWQMTLPKPERSFDPALDPGARADRRGRWAHAVATSRGAGRS